MLFLDGVYIGSVHRSPARFRWVKAPASVKLTQLTHTIAQHVARYLERLCRYITRPAVSTKRLSLTRYGKLRYVLKTSYGDGTTHVIFEPLDFTDLAHPCAHGISASMHLLTLKSNDQ